MTKKFKSSQLYHLFILTFGSYSYIMLATSVPISLWGNQSAQIIWTIGLFEWFG